VSTSFSELYQQRFGLDPKYPDPIAQDNVLSDILARRTHRRYTDEPIEEPLLERLIACGLSASAKSDLQQASIVVVRDSEAQASIGSWIPSMPWVASAPRLLIFCGDHRRTRTLFSERKWDFPNDNVDMFMNAAIDAGLVMQTLTLAAEAAGLGCCPISEVRTHIEPLSSLLALPDYVFPICGLCIGYPAQQGFVSMRLPPSLTVHDDTYDDQGLAGKITDYDERRNARFSLPADRQREPERFGTAQLYGWSEDKARQYATPHRGEFKRYLHARGFALD
jgi:nitroreductase/FMN reductase [NAD(P)H]